ncbi:MAG: protein kinase [Proteobacteria bacterium]|nr:protein kinase [Pseudomonadota bacterium]
MDNAGNSSLGNAGGRRVGEPRESGVRASIHGARPAVPGRTRADSVIARAPSMAVSRVAPAVSQTAARVSQSQSPVQRPTSAPPSRAPSPAVAASAPMPSSPAKPAVVYGTPLEEDLNLAATAALSPEELEAAGLPPMPEGLEDEPEIDLEQTTTTLPIGMKIDDRYEILSVLGIGGFATVYRAHHLTIDRDVALKVMDLKKGVDPSYSQRFFREAKIAAKIHHNNVVSIYDFGHVAETGQPYIAMEMLHGHDLSHELTESGPLSPQRAFVLFRPVLDALAQGHRLGIVHKDLKPENLYLVDPKGPHETIKVLDFGVARINSSEVAKLTSAGQLLGTPRYLAPEYIKQQLVSPAIDVYQMALILSEALTGIPAVSGDPFHAMMLHCSGQLQIAGFLLEGEVGEVYKKAIAINPEDRYADCEAFGQALDTVVEYFSSKVPLKGGAPQLTPDGRTSSKMTAMPFNANINTGEPNMYGGEMEQQKGNGKVLVILGILLVLIVAAFVIYYYYKEWEDQVKPPVVVENAEPAPDPTYEFTFETMPRGATVLKNGTHLICSPTPCQAEFKASELKYSQLMFFKLDGYMEERYELKESTYNDVQGKILIELKEKPKEISELVFTLKYEPENASVTDIKMNNTKVCSGSPCKYTFTLDRGYAQLEFKADGYKTKTEILGKEEYDQNSGVIKVTLEKEAAAPQRPSPGPRRNTTTTNKPVNKDNNDDKPATPPPQPKPAPKPIVLD